MGIVYRAIAAQLARKAGVARCRARTGAVTLIQRFGSALNLNLHFQMLFLDGVYVEQPGGRLGFVEVAAPTSAECSRLVATIARRESRLLERQGLLKADAQAGVDDPLASLRGASITYRIAVGRHAGRKVATLQDLPATELAPCKGQAVAALGGSSLHAGVAARAGQCAKLERLCRYITRPAVSEQRLWLTPDGWVGYALKTPWRDGTTQVFFEPLDFLARLAALLPNPRINLTRFHGVFAPNLVALKLTI